MDNAVAAQLDVIGGIPEGGSDQNQHGRPIDFFYVNWSL